MKPESQISEEIPEKFLKTVKNLGNFENSKPGKLSGESSKTFNPKRYQTPTISTQSKKQMLQRANSIMKSSKVVADKSASPNPASQKISDSSLTHNIYVNKYLQLKSVEKQDSQNYDFLKQYQELKKAKNQAMTQSKTQTISETMAEVKAETIMEALTEVKPEPIAEVKTETMNEVEAEVITETMNEVDAQVVTETINEVEAQVVTEPISVVKYVTTTEVKAQQMTESRTPTLISQSKVFSNQGFYSERGLSEMKKAKMQDVLSKFKNIRGVLQQQERIVTKTERNDYMNLENIDDKGVTIQIQKIHGFHVNEHSKITGVKKLDRLEEHQKYSQLEIFSFNAFQQLVQIIKGSPNCIIQQYDLEPRSQRSTVPYTKIMNELETMNLDNQIRYLELLLQQKKSQRELSENLNTPKRAKSIMFNFEKADRVYEKIKERERSSQQQPRQSESLQQTITTDRVGFFSHPTTETIEVNQIMIQENLDNLPELDLKKKSSKNIMITSKKEIQKVESNNNIIRELKTNEGQSHTVSDMNTSIYNFQETNTLMRYNPASQWSKRKLEQALTQNPDAMPTDCPETQFQCQDQDHQNKNSFIKDVSDNQQSILDDRLKTLQQSVRDLDKECSSLLQQYEKNSIKPELTRIVSDPVSHNGFMVEEQPLHDNFVQTDKDTFESQSIITQSHAQTNNQIKEHRISHQTQKVNDFKHKKNSLQNEVSGGNARIQGSGDSSPNQINDFKIEVSSVDMQSTNQKVMKKKDWAVSNEIKEENEKLFISSAEIPLIQKDPQQNEPFVTLKFVSEQNFNESKISYNALNQENQLNSAKQVMSEEDFQQSVKYIGQQENVVENAPFGQNQETEINNEQQSSTEQHQISSLNVEQNQENQLSFANKNSSSQFVSQPDDQDQHGEYQVEKILEHQKCVSEVVPDKKEEIQEIQLNQVDQKVAPQLNNNFSQSNQTSYHQINENIQNRAPEEQINNVQLHYNLNDQINCASLNTIEGQQVCHQQQQMEIERVHQKLQDLEYDVKYNQIGEDLVRFIEFDYRNFKKLSEESNYPLEEILLFILGDFLSKREFEKNEIQQYPNYQNMKKVFIEIDPYGQEQKGYELVYANGQFKHLQFDFKQIPKRESQQETEYYHFKQEAQIENKTMEAPQMLNLQSQIPQQQPVQTPSIQYQQVIQSNMASQKDNFPSSRKVSVKDFQNSLREQSLLNRGTSQHESQNVEAQESNSNKIEQQLQNQGNSEQRMQSHSLQGSQKYQPEQLQLNEGNSQQGSQNFFVQNFYNNQRDQSFHYKGNTEYGNQNLGAQKSSIVQRESSQQNLQSINSINSEMGSQKQSLNDIIENPYRNQREESIQNLQSIYSLHSRENSQKTIQRNSNLTLERNHQEKTQEKIQNVSSHQSRDNIQQESQKVSVYNFTQELREQSIQNVQIAQSLPQQVNSQHDSHNVITQNSQRSQREHSLQNLQNVQAHQTEENVKYGNQNMVAQNSQNNLREQSQQNQQSIHTLHSRENIQQENVLVGLQNSPHTQTEHSLQKPQNVESNSLRVYSNNYSHHESVQSIQKNQGEKILQNTQSRQQLQSQGIQQNEVGNIITQNSQNTQRHIEPQSYQKLVTPNQSFHSQNVEPLGNHSVISNQEKNSVSPVDSQIYQHQELNQGINNLNMKSKLNVGSSQMERESDPLLKQKNNQKSEINLPCYDNTESYEVSSQQNQSRQFNQQQDQAFILQKQNSDFSQEQILIKLEAVQQHQDQANIHHAHQNFQVEERKEEYNGVNLPQREINYDLTPQQDTNVSSREFIANRQQNNSYMNQETRQAPKSPFKRETKRISISHGYSLNNGLDYQIQRKYQQVNTTQDQAETQMTQSTQNFYKEKFVEEIPVQVFEAQNEIVGKEQFHVAETQQRVSEQEEINAIEINERFICKFPAHDNESEIRPIQDNTLHIDEARLEEVSEIPVNNVQTPEKYVSESPVGGLQGQNIYYSETPFCFVENQQRHQQEVPVRVVENQERFVSEQKVYSNENSQRIVHQQQVHLYQPKNRTFSQKETPVTHFFKRIDQSPLLVQNQSVSPVTRDFREQNMEMQGLKIKRNQTPIRQKQRPSNSFNSIHSNNEQISLEFQQIPKTHVQSQQVTQIQESERLMNEAQVNQNQEHAHVMQNSSIINEAQNNKSQKTPLKSPNQMPLNQFFTEVPQTAPKIEVNRTEVNSVHINDLQETPEVLRQDRQLKDDQINCQQSTPQMEKIEEFNLEARIHQQPENLLQNKREEFCQKKVVLIPQTSEIEPKYNHVHEEGLQSPQLIPAFHQSHSQAHSVLPSSYYEDHHVKQNHSQAQINETSQINQISQSQNFHLPDETQNLSNQIHQSQAQETYQQQSDLIDQQILLSQEKSSSFEQNQLIQNQLSKNFEKVSVPSFVRVETLPFPPIKVQICQQTNTSKNVHSFNRQNNEVPTYLPKPRVSKEEEVELDISKSVPRKLSIFDAITRDIISTQKQQIFSTLDKEETRFEDVRSNQPTFRIVEVDQNPKVQDQNHLEEVQTHQSNVTVKNSYDFQPKLQNHIDYQKVPVQGIRTSRFLIEASKPLNENHYEQRLKPHNEKHYQQRSKSSIILKKTDRDSYHDNNGQPTKQYLLQSNLQNPFGHNHSIQVTQEENLKETVYRSVSPMKENTSKNSSTNKTLRAHLESNQNNFSFRNIYQEQAERVLQQQMLDKQAQEIPLIQTDVKKIQDHLQINSTKILQSEEQLSGQNVKISQNEQQIQSLKQKIEFIEEKMLSLVQTNNILSQNLDKFSTLQKNDENDQFQSILAELHTLKDRMNQLESLAQNEQQIQPVYNNFHHHHHHHHHHLYQEPEQGEEEEASLFRTKEEEYQNYGYPQSYVQSYQRNPVQEKMVNVFDQHQHVQHKNEEDKISIYTTKMYKSKVIDQTQYFNQNQ